MKKVMILLTIVWSVWLTAAAIPDTMKPWKTHLDKLSTFEKHVLVDKWTESAFSGEYVYSKEEGVYRCKVCGASLYKSQDKFDSHCGWPSFDDAITGAVKEVPDKDGMRTEIVCARCGAHLGHVFRGEGYTSKNMRHCVNSVSVAFEKKRMTSGHEARAYFAGGCFWGVEYYMEQIDGVREVRSGYMGGKGDNPTYEEVSTGKTGYLETVEVVYDPIKVTYETLVKTFFEIHDPTQNNGQGPDIGSQYLSAVFVGTKDERKITQRLIGILTEKGYNITTRLRDTTTFFPAEAYHQNYYERKGSTPYCHRRIKRFD